MSLTVSDLPFTTAEIARAGRVNRMLDLFPRFGGQARQIRIGHRLLRLSQVGSDARLRRRGLAVETRTIAHDGHHVPVRIILPPGKPTGVVLDIHGGGWVFGNAVMDDPANARLALRAGLAIVSVEYRLLDEARGIGLVDALDDCTAAALWLLDHAGAEFRTERLLIAGESAGAHLAALTLLRLRDRGRIDRFQGAIMLYGAYDLTGTPSVMAAGRHTLILNGSILGEELRRLARHSADPRLPAPDASPLKADLIGLPPAILVVGDIDPLVDDTLRMADRWSAVAPVDLVVVPDGPHGFTQFPGPLSARVNAHILSWVRQCGVDPVSVDNPNR